MKSFELILYPTEQCNFRCSYCYEDFEVGKMLPEVVDNVKKFINNRLDVVDHLHLSWFGGEPLIAQDILLDIANHAFQESKKRNKKLTGSFTTNAYHLTVELAKQFHEINHNKYQISLDGYQEQHDKTRKLASGKGTFNKIWTNLINLKDSDIQFEILLRLHITRENFESMKVLAYEIKDKFIIDYRFKVLVKPIGSWGGNNKIKDAILSKDEQDNAIDEILKIIYPNNDRIFTVNNKETKNICYASKPNSLAIRSQGTIQKCTVLLSDERNNVGNLTNDGEIFLDSELMKLWMRGLYDKNYVTLGCPAYNLPKIIKNKIDVISINN
ncbi:hypothetical protein F971_00859 [Acinetobacter vivianii]|uniref:Radical SAM core domain-containing protein n=1 Tax=Acinetobacter vivianii TaxID=1776742 RepID=N8V1A7_9GAMM|nr:radical SAM protein [Acinetobacter vivianii]ENU93601.1 hypothetical protein F971_00859 [Acinetobacter vivianii]